VTQEGRYTIIPDMSAGERTDLMFRLKEYETIEIAGGVRYQVRWKGSAVLALEPRGAKAPLYAGRAPLRAGKTPLCAPRYP
jgi:hypothetical protein